MPELALRFTYVAIDSSGRRVRGVVPATDERAAFELLKRDGLAPVAIRSHRVGSDKAATAGRAKLSEEAISEFFFDLGALLAAGADIRAALGILGARADRWALGVAAKAVAAEIGAGSSLEVSLSKVLGERAGPMIALATAGEASGELARSLERAAASIALRLELRRKIVSALSYPAFVLASTIAAICIILFLVIPSLAPLASTPGVKPPLPMRVLLWASDAARAHWGEIVGGCGGILLGGLIGGRIGLLRTPIDRILLDLAPGRTIATVTYAGFAVILGQLLNAGTPMSEALPIALRTVRIELARARLERSLSTVREGERLSTALSQVPGAPATIVRLAEIGEEAGALGTMLERAGNLELEAAVKRIEAFAQVLGPALIVILGALIGALMASLLTGVTDMGASALQ